MKGKFATVLASLVVVGSVAWTDAQAQTYTVPAGDAGSRIKDLIRQAHWSAVWDDGLLDNVRTQAVSGESDPDIALGKMLAGTRLTYCYTSARFIVIYMPTVTVCVEHGAVCVASSLVPH